MASKRHQRRRSCERKVAHATEEAAAIEAKRLRRKGCGLVRWYKCGFCPAWHVGHADKRTRQAISANFHRN